MSTPSLSVHSDHFVCTFFSGLFFSNSVIDWFHKTERSREKFGLNRVAEEGAIDYVSGGREGRGQTADKCQA